MNVETLIIGSGVAATTIAQSLLERDPAASILMLDAGRRVKTKDFAVWENYLVTGRLPYENCRDLDYPDRDYAGENSRAARTPVTLQGARLFAYGGSTLHWGGWAFRLKPEDFELRSRTGNGADWPISYAQLERYYCRAEEYLAVSGDSGDRTVPRSMEYPFRAFPFTLQDEPLAAAFDKLAIAYGNLPIARRGVSKTPSRHAPCQTTGTCKYCPFGARYVASDYLDDLRTWNDYPNLDIRLGIVVDRINTSSKSKAVSIDFFEPATRSAGTIEAQRIIVAAGAIESANLLLRSRSNDWPSGLGNVSDALGRNFVTHPYFIFSGTMPSNPERLQPEMNFPTLVSRFYDSVDQQRLGKFILVNPPDAFSVNVTGLMQAGRARSDIEAYITGSVRVQLHGMVEVFSQSSNRVAPLSKRNRFGVPQTRVEYTPEVSFDARMAQIKVNVQEIFAAMGAELTDDASVSWRADHAGCTCRMSSSDTEGVVDENLKVHGLNNLFLCSNAVFPSIGAVNPTLTLTALAIRLGDYLSGSGYRESDDARSRQVDTSKVAPNGA